MSKPITISIVGNAGPLKKSIKEADVALDKFGQGLKKFGLAAAAGMGAVAAGIGFAAKAAAEDQKSFALMETAIRNVTGATKEHIAQVDKQLGAMSIATGIADDKLRPAFAALTRGTRDIETATRDFGIVLDVSTALGLDQTAVAEALAKGYEGNMKALAQLSPELKTMIRDGADMNQVLDVLAANFGGATATAAETFEGRMARLNVAFSEIVEQIGYAVLPMLTQIAEFIAESVVPVIQEFADAFSADGLSGAIGLSIDKMLQFYDEAGNTTKVVISTTIAVGGLYAALKTLTFIQTITTMINGLGTALSVATVKMAGFQTAALGMLKTVGLVIGSLAISIDSLLADNAFAARGLMESVAKLANVVIAAVEATFNSAIIAVNVLNKAVSFIPGVEIAPISLLNFGRISEDFGSVGAFERGQPSPTRDLSGITDSFDRTGAGRNISPPLPTIVAPTIEEATVGGSSGGSAGGSSGGSVGGGSRRSGGGSMFNDFSLGGLDSSYSGDLFSLDALAARSNVVNITVNTVSADANLPNLIVDALQQYNLYNGPLDVQIAA
jgi:uncharacterized membrane protein YgcG